MLDLKRDFGAACDDTTPDDVPFAAALVALAQQGGELRVEGRPLLTRRHTQSAGRKLRIVGEGEIRWATPEAGFHLTMTTLDRPVVEGLSFICSHLAQANALTVTAPYVASGTHSGPILRDLIFTGQDTAQHSWRTALRLERCWNSEIPNNTVKGQDDGDVPFVADCGIELFECMAAELTNNDVWHTEEAIRTVGSAWSEGINISGGELVGVRRGIVFNGAQTIASGGKITNVHINAYERGIVANNRRLLDIVGNEVFKCHLSRSYFQAVEMLYCVDIDVLTNKFNGYPQATGGNDLVTAGACTGIEVHGNRSRDFSGPGTMALLFAGSTSCVVTGNPRRGTGVAYPVNAGGAGNVVSD